MDESDIMDALSSQDPDKIKSILALGNSPDKMAMLQNQLAQASALRNTPMQGMRQPSYRVGVAANPLEVVGNLADKAAGTYMQNKANAGINAQLDQNTTGRMNYLDVIRRAMASKSPQLLSRDPNALQGNDPAGYGGDGQL